MAKTSFSCARAMFWLWSNSISQVILNFQQVTAHNKGDLNDGS